MRFNFWQWLGIALLLVGLAVIYWKESHQPAATTTTPAPASPATSTAN